MSTVPELDLDAIEVPSEVACQFRLGGRHWHCRTAGAVPFDTVARLVGAKDDAQAIVQVEPFFRAVLVPEEGEDFCALLHAEDSPLTLERIQALVEYVSEHVLARPTERPKRSAPGSQGKRTTSTAA